MSYEIAMIVFGLTTFVMLVIEVNYTYATQGYAFGWSANRDPNAKFTPLAQRIKNAYQNQVESAAYGVPILAAASLVNLEHTGAELAALLFVVARAAYAPLYYSGIPYARLPAFGVGVLSIGYLAVVLALA